MLGNRPKDGNIVICTYLDNVGIVSNNITGFSFVEKIGGKYRDNVSTTTVVTSYGGVDKESIDQIKLTLRGKDGLLSVYVDVYDNSLSHKWLSSLNNLLDNNYHLEKNYCFFGFVKSLRNGQYILDQVNKSIQAIQS